jgi:hypothetical protein
VFARLGHPKTVIDHVDNLCVDLDGNADGKLTVSGDISGQVSSGNITLFTVGIPGLSIPKYVIAGLGPHTTDSNSRLIVEFLISVPNLTYWAALTPISDFKM